ncbi:NAD-dependent epimerase/dehydratase family protein [Pedobacter psychrodurus]|uniref:NAD-dependent epimerase/dehydratase family protein n=1 Tax=Pedobacter psychrodurus TaxID=2530456 RepID=A0A4R0PP37_9SPHI|nr:NAD-dependent epimerase/dehydratase family protein [Pedobacter psychrodurus]TCD17347.1 NAD-dependent epimerase/dehydratase family protein [Pedobacter psychrodurus]
MDILLTGASGFLGRHIYNELKTQGDITTLSRSGSDISVNLDKDIPKLDHFDIVVHAAGKAHSVPKTELEIKSFYDVNLIGTKNLLLALEQSFELPKFFVFISSVAVYGRESGNNINENTVLLAKDPYGLSKIAAEELVIKWCALNNVVCTVLRLPLLVGKNPPGNLGAMIKGIKKGYYFNIAGGKARKSMVLVSDVAKLIPKVAEIGGIYNLTDGHHPSFADLSTSIARQVNKPKPINIPLWFAKIMAMTGDLLGTRAPINTSKLNKITSDLTFDDSHAKEKLDWSPTSVLTKKIVNSRYSS